MSTEPLPEVTGTDGEIPGGLIAIVASRYNANICDALVGGAKDSLIAAGVDEKSMIVARVPGAWELPLISQTFAERSDVVAVITLGCVIKGETSHDEHINRAVSLSLMEMGVRLRKPIAFGLLTCNTLEQALNRSGGNVGNKGNEAAEAVIELLRLRAKI